MGGARSHPVTSFAAVTVHNQLWVLCGYSFTAGRSCSDVARYHLVLLGMRFNSLQFDTFSSAMFSEVIVLSVGRGWLF